MVLFFFNITYIRTSPLLGTEKDVSPEKGTSFLLLFMLSVGALTLPTGQNQGYNWHRLSPNPEYTHS